MDNINTFSLLGALIGFLWGVYQYKKSIDLKRAEWIHKIFNTFYLEEKFKHIKKGVVYAEILDPSIAEVLKYYIAKSNGKPFILSPEIDRDAIIEELINFFNFFEFIIYLVEINQIFHRDVQVMFHGFLTRIGRHELIVEFLKRTGYEKTSKYLRENT